MSTETEISARGVHGLLVLLLPNPSSPGESLILGCSVEPFTRCLHGEALSTGPTALPGS